MPSVSNIKWTLEATPTKRQLYCHLPPIMKTIKIRWTRHAGHCWRSCDELIVMYFCGPLHMNEQRQDDQLEPIYSSSVPIRYVALKTYRKQWTIGRGGKRGSGISVLIARHDDESHNTCLTLFSLCWSHLYTITGLNFNLANVIITNMRSPTS